MDNLQNSLFKLDIDLQTVDSPAAVDPTVPTNIFRNFDPQQREKPDIIFVCLDCEAFEWDQAKVTEIGVAVLDTRDTWSIEPSAPPSAIVEKIQSAHYRPTEYSSLVNKKFVRGCPAAFGFGTSTWVRKTDIPTILKRIFQDPTHLRDAARFDIEILSDARDIIVVGHGLGIDDKYLQSLGFSFDSVVNIIGDIDTQKLARPKPPIALKTLLAALEIEAVNLHNAGNDAVYTMQAFVKIATLKSHEPGHLDEVIRSIKGKPLDRHDLSVEAPKTWGGSARAGDEHLPKQSAIARRQFAPRYSRQNPSSHKDRRKRLQNGVA